MRELPIKKVRDPEGKTGSIYTVSSVDEDPCGGKYNVSTDKGVFRLPIGLFTWALMAIEGSNTVEGFFPCEVEFCKLENGRVSADFLTHRGKPLPKGRA